MSNYFGGDYPESEFDKHSGDREWLEEGQDLYEDMLDKLIEDFPDVEWSDRAADLMFQGWFDPDTDRFDRVEAQWDFFELTGLDWEDFDWDSWREWYDET